MVRRKRGSETDWTYAEALPWPPSGTRVGLLIICVTVTGCPKEFVVTSVDVKADGADNVVEPWLSVVVMKTVD